MNQTINLLQEAFLIEDRTEADNLYLHEMAAIVFCFADNWDSVIKHLQIAKKINPDGFLVKVASAFLAFHEVEVTSYKDAHQKIAALNHSLLAIYEFNRHYQKPKDLTERNAGLHMFITLCLIQATKNIIHLKKPLDQALHSIQFGTITSDPQNLVLLYYEHKQLLREYMSATEGLIGLVALRKVFHNID